MIDMHILTACHHRCITMSSMDLTHDALKTLGQVTAELTAPFFHADL